MEPLKPVDYKVLFELMKDSHRSDREVGRAAGISQPTISRRRLRLEKDIIYGYTALPKLGKFGFELAALTFIKTRSSSRTLWNSTSRQHLLRIFADSIG